MHKFTHYCLVPAFVLACDPVFADVNPQTNTEPVSIKSTDETSPPTDMMDNPAQAQQQRLLDNQEYLQKVDNIELEAGAYASELTEPLLSLGLSYQQQGNHLRAIDVFKRAMHINRINEGLYNLGQVDILEPLIASHMARRQWKNVNKRYDYLYWLLRRNAEQDDKRLLPLIYKLSGWYLDSYSAHAGLSTALHLMNANDLYSMAVDIIDAQYGENDLRLVNALRGLAVSNYYLANNSVLLVDQQINSNTTVDEQVTPKKYRLASYVNKSFSSGVKAISRMIDVYASNPMSPRFSQEKALVELGDWYLRFNKRDSAFSQYQLAYELLVKQQATQEEINTLFGWPVALSILYQNHHELARPPQTITMMQVPKYTQATAKSLSMANDSVASTGNLERPLPESLGSTSGTTSIGASYSLASGVQPRYVVVSFDVTRTGKTRNIEVVESQPSDAYSIRSKARDYLKVTRFRPRFSDGTPVLTRRVTHRYLFPGKN